MTYELWLLSIKFKKHSEQNKEKNNFYDKLMKMEK